MARRAPETVAVGCLASRSWGSRAVGFTLIEVIVVLLVLGLATALVAPAFITRQDPGSELAVMVRNAREMASRRGENLFLDVGTGGDWSIYGVASLEAGRVAAGRLQDYAGPRFRLVLSPVGTCAFDVRSTQAAAAIPIDLLRCELEE